MFYLNILLFFDHVFFIEILNQNHDFPKNGKKKFGANQKKRGFVHTPRVRFSRRYQTSKNISQVLVLFCPWLVSTILSTKCRQMSTKCRHVHKIILNMSRKSPLACRHFCRHFVDTFCRQKSLRFFTGGRENP